MIGQVPFLITIATVAVSLAEELAAQTGRLLNFYGLTAGFLSTLYALYTKDPELRVTHRELLSVLIKVILAFIIQCGLWFIVVILKWKYTWMVLPLSFLGLFLYVWALIDFFVRVTVLSMLRIDKLKDLSFCSTLKHLPLVKGFYRRRKRNASHRYERTHDDRPTFEAYTVLKSIAGDDVKLQQNRGASFAVIYPTSAQWLSLLAKFVREQIDKGETVTLVTCRHHPTHVLDYIEDAFQTGDKQQLRRQLAVIDAFTDAFGGDDEIFHTSLEDHRADGYQIISASSIAGIHSGTAKAFKYFKSTTNGKRLPATVIYDGLLVYQHYEAQSQLSKFLIHMTEAERAYAMITLLGEPTCELKSPFLGTIRSVVDRTRVMNVDGVCKAFTGK